MKINPAITTVALLAPPIAACVKSLLLAGLSLVVRQVPLVALVSMLAVCRKHEDFGELHQPAADLARPPDAGCWNNVAKVSSSDK